jgi:hypothetical protein
MLVIELVVVGQGPIGDQHGYAVLDRVPRTARSAAGLVGRPGETGVASGTDEEFSQARRFFRGRGTDLRRYYGHGALWLAAGRDNLSMAALT